MFTHLHANLYPALLHWIFIKKKHETISAIKSSVSFYSFSKLQILYEATRQREDLFTSLMQPRT
jgi:hypothetical protein